MKKMKTLLIVLAISLTGVMYAGNDPIKEKPFTKVESSMLAKEISSLLEEPSFEIEKEIQTKITFISNKENEIIVLKVDTGNELFDDFIKSRLNYSELSTKLKNNRIYELPIKVVIAE